MQVSYKELLNPSVPCLTQLNTVLWYTAPETFSKYIKASHDVWHLKGYDL